ncbi:MAG: hypothetical protein HQ515_08340 [Phycisphaeraceae bacterium]|nr:hypothetical protein [Phycisphaeraceae bacterium]
MRRLSFPILLCIIAAFSPQANAQHTATPVTRAWQQFSANKQQSVYAGLAWETLGPVINSGRVETLDVVPGQPGTIYVGFGSGNLWKTTNHGFSWKPIFDDHPGYSIGDVCIAPSQSRTVYVATGENLRAKRGHTFAGAGVYRSDDAGETWRSLGLEDTFHVGRVAVHPTNPDIVFVAALGHFYSANTQRGLYKSSNGGRTWRRVLFVDDRTGASDVVISPADPSVVYASTWQCSEAIGGPGSAVYRSTDGGDTWTECHGGLPSGSMNGRTGLAVSTQNPNRVYALTDNLNLLGEQDTGELYRSDDGGKTWIKPHAANLKIFSSFGHVFTDCFVNPADDNEVYVLGIAVLRSADGGQSFEQLGGTVRHINPSPAQAFHLDHHDMWINPNNPDHLMVGNDGGLYMSYDKAQSWMHYNNIPAGEFYFVRTDNDTPYRIYSGTQDDAAVRGPAVRLRTDSPDAWEYVWIDPWSGGDGVVTAPDPADSNTVYFEAQNGDVRRKHMPTGHTKGITPRLPKTHEGKLFHEWLTPFFVSKYNPLTLYYGGNYVFKSIDRGDHWQTISPDLSASSDPARCGQGVAALAESPVSQGLMYSGTSEGALWVTRNDGVDWTEISTGLPAQYIKSIAPSRFKPSRVYVTLSGIKTDNFASMVYCSEDQGATWTSIVSNLPDAPVNVILEDPAHEQVLYCGTFSGVFVSVNRGQSWQVLGAAMPHCFVADMTIQTREKDLIAVTHGRGIYKLDLEPLYATLADPSDKARCLYITEAMLPSKDASGNRLDLTSYEPVQFHVYLPAAETLTMEVTDAEQKVIMSSTVTSVKGFNTFFWDLVTQRVEKDNPYHFKTHIFPEAGAYSVRWRSSRTDIEAAFAITRTDRQ